MVLVSRCRVIPESEMIQFVSYNIVSIFKVRIHHVTNLRKKVTKYRFSLSVLYTATAPMPEYLFQANQNDETVRRILH
jgi:hypothetical protein